jgi:hypothetical protein
MGSHRHERKDDMSNTIKQLAVRCNMSYDEFIGEMRKRGCSEPTAAKIWNGYYEDFEAFNDNDIYLSNLRKAADVFKVKTGALLSK